jgi:hypothetical protein
VRWISGERILEGERHQDLRLQRLHRLLSQDFRFVARQHSDRSLYIPREAGLSQMRLRCASLSESGRAALRGRWLSVSF